MNKGTPVEPTHKNLAVEMDARYPGWAYRVRELGRELDDKTNKVKHLNGILEVIRLGDPSVAQIIKLTEDRDRLQLENNALGKSLTYWQQRAFGAEDILKTIQDIGEAAHSVESLRNIARIAKEQLEGPLPGDRVRVSREIAEAVAAQVGWHGDGEFDRERFYCEECKMDHEDGDKIEHRPWCALGQFKRLVAASKGEKP